MAKSQEQRKQMQIEVEKVMKSHEEALQLEYQARETMKLEKQEM